jgi:RND family efflux transporter MFP subunit
MAWILGLQCLWGMLWMQVAGADELATAPVTQVVVPRIYHLDGVVEATQASTISAQTSGQVRRVLFDVDDLVQAGQVLIEIDDTQQKAALAKAQANLKSAQARLVNADKEYRRIRRVFAKKVVSKSAMDKASSTRRAAQGAVEAARAALVQARQQLEYTRVRAPYTGIVTRRMVEVGEVVSVGQQLMSGLSLERLRVNVDVPQSVVEAVRREQDAAIRVHGKWYKMPRLVVFPVADTATATFRVRLQAPPGVKGLFPGMYVKTALSVGKRRVLAVPAAAVVYRSEVIGVYVVDDQGRVRLRHVRLGNRLADGRLVVLSGLQAGERVAMDPQAAVRVVIAQRKERAADEN